MSPRFLSAAALSALVAIAGIAPTARAQQSAVVNRGVVELETAGTTGISVRIGEELANLIDDGATRRLVPVVGKGALQNLIDLKYLRGIDMAILPIDVLDYAREQKIVSAADMSIYYIAKLYNEEFHLLARGDIKTVADLANRKVNVGPLGAGSAITATRLFNRLKLPVT
ncbi:MAG: TRAP transporter substrate-binding protein, partial [Alphaproteobacteria bacterium]|nr:TRAP transporter substrate-binding protein [Alphaproteobacteria bacterium]